MLEVEPTKKVILIISAVSLLRYWSFVLQSFDLLDLEERLYVALNAQVAETALEALFSSINKTHAA